MSFIKSYCLILPGSIDLDGEKYFESEHKPFNMNVFFSEIYKYSKIDYRRFFKMDALSKLGFLASELLLKGVDREQPKHDMGIIFFNRSSSLEADVCYQKTIQRPNDFYPSPAEFVHTLPNIVMGEIAIRNKIYGETVFYAMPALYKNIISEMIDDTMYYAGMKNALAGWVEVDIFNNTLKCLMMLCTMEHSDPEIDVENFIFSMK